MNSNDSDDGWSGWCQLCLTTDSKKLLEELFACFLTIEEREMLSARYGVIQALLEGKETQREIAERLGVSISQITRGSNQLKTISAPLREFLTANMKT